MPLYRISRTPNPDLAETIGTSSGIRGALVSAASPAAAVAVANALAQARGFSNVFTPPGWVITDIATTPGGLHTDTLVDGDFSTLRGVWPGK
jgi:hypothetical protein